MRGTKLYGIVAAAFMAGAFIASPELRAYASTIANDVICSGCVGTSDLAGNAVTAAKIKDGEVKAAEIATDAVGAAELKGVTKLLFAKCLLTDPEGFSNIVAGGVLLKDCNITGTSFDDQAVASFNDGHNCFAVTNLATLTGKVNVTLRNVCGFASSPGFGSYISLVVYHK